MIDKFIIKLRAFDTYYKEMIYFSYDQNDLSNGDILNRFSCTMLYIGEKDKNGIDIYEGDILHYKGKHFVIPSAIKYVHKGHWENIDITLPVQYKHNKGFQMYLQGIGYYEIYSNNVEIINDGFNDIDVDELDKRKGF